MLVEPAHRRGLKGGYERYQLDTYNSEALMEADIHYYNAKGKTKLFNIEIKYVACVLMYSPPAFAKLRLPLSTA